MNPYTAAKMWALHGPTMTIAASELMVGGTGIVTIPLPSFLIQHPRGLVLLDTGLAPEAYPDPTIIYGELANIVGMRILEEQLLVNELAAIGFTPDDVTHVLLSHTHHDHTGGLHLFPHAKFYAGAGDIAYALWPDAAEAAVFRQTDIERVRAYDWREVPGDLDLFGDGSIVLLHLPGHTPGNKGLLVRLPNHTFLLAGDTVHLRAALGGYPTPYDWSTLDAKRSIERLGRIRDTEGATLWIGHDPEDAEQFSFSPHFYE